MTNSDQRPLTTLLLQWREGNKQAGDQLFGEVYQELRRLAGYHMRQERPGHTLQATALVNELYSRFFSSEPVQWQSKAHFLAVAAQQLRRVLINHARDRQAMKRGGKRVQVTLSAAESLAPMQQEHLLDLNRALEHLETLDPRAAQVIELRYFGGLTEQETAEVLQVSLATVKRDWDFARIWLLQQLSNK